MKYGISLVAAGLATSTFLALTFVLCVVWDWVFPHHAMYEAWIKLLPGFEWMSWSSFFIGLSESYLYGWFIALIWVPLYNHFLFSIVQRRECCNGMHADNKDDKRD